MEMGGGAAVGLFQRLRRPDDKNTLGLEIVGGGGVAAGLQNQVQLLLLNRAVTELAERIPLRGQLFKIQGSFSFFSSCAAAQQHDFNAPLPRPSGGRN